MTQILVNLHDSYGHLGSAALNGARKRREPRIRQHYAELLDRASKEDGRRMCRILHDLLGDPYTPLNVDLDWLEADAGRVRQVAEGIYQEGCFEEMAVLGDALQDAGCDDERLLSHCLEDEHYRGCWLLDALLGRG